MAALTAPILREPRTDVSIRHELNMSVMAEALAQQEMFEAPPRRRMIVFGAANSHWGVDGSTRGVSIAYVDRQGHRGARTTLFPRLKGAQWCSTVYRLTRSLTQEIVADGFIPGLVLIEQPSGPFVEHELQFAVGIIHAAIYDGVQAAGHPPPQSELIVSSWWKARACGSGAIKKTRTVNGKKKPVPRDEYQVLVWARLNGYTGSSWDEADAWAMAEAGRRDVALDAR